VERISLQDTWEVLVKLGEAKLRSALDRLEYKFLVEMEDTFVVVVVVVGDQGPERRLWMHCSR
jgi:hypothetical protein